MKNIHILPTDKPSRLYLYKSNLFLTTESHLNVPSMEYQNIYITSDEEIKEGDWFYSVRELIEKAIINYPKGEHFGKVILTTEQDLITNGIQAIDDEFLEWFVAHPSCEEVEYVGDDCYREITIPKEEPKQETLEEAAEQYAEIYRCPATNKDEYCKHDIISAINFGAKWQQERMYSEKDMKLAFEAGHKKGFSGYANTENWKELPFKEWFEQFKKK